MTKTQMKVLRATIKKKVPKESREEVLAALDSLDLDKIINNPAIMVDLLKDPSKLSQYVKEDAIESDSSEEGKDEPNV